jgi:imidazolonepropionase-like amidohydrolase
MRLRHLLPAAIVPLAVLAAAMPPTASAQSERRAPDAYAITNARIVTVSGATIARGTVVFRDGLITAVGANAAVPADARVIDGAGLTVYPGLIDAYGSLAMPEARPNQGGGRRGGPPGGPAQQGGPNPLAAPNSRYPVGLQPEVLAAELLEPDANDFAAAHAAGFTSALTAPATGIFQGQSALINLAGGDARELLVKTPVALHVGFTPLRNGGFPNSLLGVFAALRQMLLDAQRYGELQKAYARNPRGMRRPDDDPSLAALQPVLAREMPVVMLATTKREIERALDLAKEFNLRAIIAGGLEAYTVAERLKAENVPVLQTLNFPRLTQAPSADADPEPLRVLRERVESPKGPGRLAQAGVRFAFEAGGASWNDVLTDAGHAVQNGLTKDAAIRAFTLTPAEIFGVADRLGSIEPGKIANLAVVRGDLLEPGARVTQLFVDGRPVEVRAPANNGRGAGSIAAGTWTLTVTLEGSDRTVTLSMQQEGERLRGSMQGALGSGSINDGSVGADGAFRFTTSVLLEGATEEATFSGTIAGGSMRGTVQIIGHPSGTFVGTRPTGGAPGGRRPPGNTRPDATSRY